MGFPNPFENQNLSCFKNMVGEAPQNIFFLFLHPDPFYPKYIYLCREIL